jgi:PhzF family phenazine biosynthesis protein
MPVSVFIVDAFTTAEPFSGNPAAVCPLDSWLPDPLLQHIASEHNLSETAFFVPAERGYHLRWFTPNCEVDLCGHATLGSAYVLFAQLGHNGSEVRFQTNVAGELRVRRDDDLFALDFPSRPPQRVPPKPELKTILGIEPDEVWRARDLVAVYDEESRIRALTPDMEKLSKLDEFSCVVTAPGASVDFVSRFFAPARGIPEDPVTGSAHCTLIPFWAERLGREKLHSLQLSKRGGELFCEHRGERVQMAGRARLYSTGTIHAV